MKTINEIKQLVKEAEIKAEENRKNSELAKKKKEKDKLKWEIESAKRSAVEWFPEKIEEAAKKGECEYSIDIGEPGSRYTKLHIKYIKKCLKDFNPVFKEESREGCEHNYDGDSIDGTDYTYWVTRVYLSW